MLMNIEDVVGCLPGAQLGEVVDESTYKGTIKARIGPIAVTLAGTVEFEERDEAPARRTVEGSGLGHPRARRGGQSDFLSAPGECREHAGRHRDRSPALGSARAVRAGGRHDLQIRWQDHRSVRGVPPCAHRICTDGPPSWRPAARERRASGQSGSNRIRRDGRHREEWTRTAEPKEEAADLNTPAQCLSD